MKRTLLGDVLWVSLLIIITGLLVLPQTRQVFILWTTRRPYGMGFLKFAVLASMGELLALRLAQHSWKRPVGMVYKIIFWGLLGVVITWMFSFYAAGVSAVMAGGGIFTDYAWPSAIFRAFLTSVLMNLTFGIVFMGVHRISDTYIELRTSQKKPALKTIVRAVDWAGFINVVVLKTIPFFWIPAHTITFLLPAAYRVIAAAFLSIVLGVILVSAQKKPERQS